jgi:hypothetical protein
VYDIDLFLPPSNTFCIRQQYLSYLVNPRGLNGMDISAGVSYNSQQGIPLTKRKEPTEAKE